jgi:hypothetical protein
LAAAVWEVCKFADLSVGRCAGIFASFAPTIARWLASRCRRCRFHEITSA